MMNKFARIAGIAGLTLTTMASLGLGTVNVLADDAKLPAYAMDGTNAERAIADYFVNNFNTVKDDSVVIPHMDIMELQDNGSSVNVYGAYDVIEYTRDGSALVEDGAGFASEGCFTLNKNGDGTFTVASYNEVGDNASKEDVTAIFGRGLADEAFAIYCNGGNTELWNAVRASDVAYYSYDNNLGLDRIVERDNQTLSLANVSFSTSNAHTMYAQTDANVRSAGTTASTAFDGIGKGEGITVTGKANGWSRVTMNGRTGYISNSLLGDSKPAKEEKKVEKKQEKKAEEVKTGYTVGRIEAYTGDTVTINGIKASITKETKLEGGEMRVGDVAKLDYKEINGKYTATNLLTQGSPMEGVAIASDGRVADTGDNYGRGYVDAEIDESQATEAQPEITVTPSEEQEKAEEPVAETAPQAESEVYDEVVEIEE